MEKLLNQLKESKFAKGVAIVGGLSAAALLLFFASNGADDTTGGVGSRSAHQGSSTNAIEEAIARANVISIQGHELYDLESACRFQDIFVELAIPEFRGMSHYNYNVVFVWRINLERREALATENEEEYLRLVMEYNDGMLGLIGMQQEKLKEVSEAYSEKLMSVSISVFMKEQEYMQKIVGSISALKASLGSDLQFTVEDAQSIIAYFVSLIKSQPKTLVHLVKSLIQDGKPNGMIYPALKTALYDQLYLEKGFEEEDYLAVSLLPEFNQHPITQRLQQAFSSTVNEFIEYHA